MNRPTLETRIYNAYPQLTPSERRLADVMLEVQMTLPTYTAEELAQRAGVSKSTAARLIRVLGYETFPKAKREIRQERFWGSPQSKLGGEHSGARAKSTMSAMLENDITNMQRTFSAIPDEKLDTVAQNLSRASRVWIIGLRSGNGLALQAAHYMTLVREDVHVISVSSGSFSHELANIREEDAVVFIAFRRRPQALAAMIEETRAAGAWTLLISDPSAAASARAADETLRCHTQSPAPFNSFTPAMTLITFLAWRIHELREDVAADRYRRIDELVHKLDNVSTPRDQD